MPRASKGRPSQAGSRRSIAAAAREFGEEALQVWADVMRDKEAPAGARVDAANKLIDRGFGKPTEHKQIANVDASLAELTDDELADALAVLRAANGAPEQVGERTNQAKGAARLN